MRFTTLAVLVAVAGFCAAAPPAEPPKIVSLNPHQTNPPPPLPAPPSVGPLKLSPGRLQVLKASNAVGPLTWNVVQPIGPGGVRQSVVEWFAMPKGSPICGFMEGDSKARKHVFDSETLVVLGTGEGGGYVLVQLLAVEGGVVRTVAETMIEVVGPRPPPDPVPVPTNAAWLVVVEETSQRTPAQAVLLNDQQLWQRLKAKGVNYRLYDKDSPDAANRGYLSYPAPDGKLVKYADEVGLPYVLVLDAQGKDAATGGVPRAVKLPVTVAGLEALAGVAK